MRKTSDLIFSPNDVATLGYEYLQYRHDHKEFAVEFPVKSWREKVYPLAAGEVMSLIARPGNMKTGLMMLWARQRAGIVKQTDGRVVVYATWEQSIEELHSFYVAAQQKISVTKMAKGDLSKDDFNRVMDASAQRISEPLFFVGHSVMRKTGRTPMNVDTLGMAIDEIQGRGLTVDMLYVDYLQRIAHDGRENPVTAYSNIMDSLKDLALGAGIPICVGVQASREVENLEFPVPEMHHAQWTSNVEQSSDRVFSLLRLRRYAQEGEQLGGYVVKGQNQLIVRCLKQKLGEANMDILVNVDPIYNRLDDNEMEA